MQHHKSSKKSLVLSFRRIFQNCDMINIQRICIQVKVHLHENNQSHLQSDVRKYNFRNIFWNK